MEKKIERKKYNHIFLLCFLLVFLFFLIFISIPKEVRNVILDPMSFMGDTKTTISKFMGIDIRSCQILQEQDSHGGFHGDGQTYVELKATKAEFNKIVGNMTSKWKDFPLTENLSALVYGTETETKKQLPLIIDEKENVSLIPMIENGYYYFQDRFADSSDPADDSQLFKRNSWNFTLVMLDKDQNKIYYIKYDT